MTDLGITKYSEAILKYGTLQSGGGPLLPIPWSVLAPVIAHMQTMSPLKALVKDWPLASVIESSYGEQLLGYASTSIIVQWQGNSILTKPSAASESRQLKRWALL